MGRWLSSVFTLRLLPVRSLCKKKLSSSVCTIPAPLPPSVVIYPLHSPYISHGCLSVQDRCLSVCVCVCVNEMESVRDCKEQTEATCSISSICMIEGGTLARGRDRASSSFRLRVMMFLKWSRASWRTDGSFPWEYTHTHTREHSFLYENISMWECVYVCVCTCTG